MCVMCKAPYRKCYEKKERVIDDVCLPKSFVLFFTFSQRECMARKKKQYSKFNYISPKAYAVCLLLVTEYCVRARSFFSTVSWIFELFFPLNFRLNNISRKVFFIASVSLSIHAQSDKCVCVCIHTYISTFI